VQPYGTHYQHTVSVMIDPYLSHSSIHAREEKRRGSIVLKTPFQSLSIPVSYQVMKGSLSVLDGAITLPRAAFPGKILRTSITVISSYE